MNETFEACARIYLKIRPAQKKYESEENIEKIVDRMFAYGLTVPSDTLVQRAISELVAEGAIQRADGGNPETDRAAAAAAEKARLDRIANAPLTDREFDGFVRLSPDELEQKYYSDQDFRARYDRACKEWGFRKPLPPVAPVTEVSAEADTSKWRTLDAKTYYAMSVADVRSLYKTDPGFRRATDRLIKVGAI